MLLFVFCSKLKRLFVLLILWWRSLSVCDSGIFAEITHRLWEEINATLRLPLQQQKLFLCSRPAFHLNHHSTGFLLAEETTPSSSHIQGLTLNLPDVNLGKWGKRLLIRVVNVSDVRQILHTADLEMEPWFPPSPPHTSNVSSLSDDKYRCCSLTLIFLSKR